MERVESGMSVVATSGRRIGVVVDVGKGVLRIRMFSANDDGDVWLEEAAIFTVEDEKVTLICEEDGLHRYKASRG